MAEAPKIPGEAETRARWGAFAWTEENQAKANEILGRYPKGREGVRSGRKAMFGRFPGSRAEVLSEYVSRGPGSEAFR